MIMQMQKHSQNTVEADIFKIAMYCTFLQKKWSQ